jgi:hypothetical protein
MSNHWVHKIKLTNACCLFKLRLRDMLIQSMNGLSYCANTRSVFSSFAVTHCILFY